jgi:hypothetical protein
MPNNTDEKFDYSLIVNDEHSNDHHTRFMFLQVKDTPKRKKVKRNKRIKAIA